MMNKTYYVYILTNWNNKVMYVGMTNDIHRRLYEHQRGVLEGFTKKYDVHKLVYLESCGEVKDAIAREKQIKSWSRIKKNQLVETINPEWKEITL